MKAERNLQISKRLMSLGSKLDKKKDIDLHKSQIYPSTSDYSNHQGLVSQYSNKPYANEVW